MNTYIGIDLGTSAVKLLLVGEDGAVLARESRAYPVLYPHSGWSEQDPDEWIAAVESGVSALLAHFDAKDVKGISCGGQMHGLVILDEDDKVIRPCILWNDGRTAEQTQFINETVKNISDLTANIAFAGFTAPKILWLRQHEPENFARIRKIMLPKDYLTYRLTGTFCTDYSDASGTLLLDVKNRDWSGYMCELCGVSREQLPRLLQSYESAGLLKKGYADRWGMGEVTVAAGAGDNAAAAIGTGNVHDGDCTISLGTSGTVFVSQDNFSVDGNNALHSFCHANGRYHLMGCILSAASCNGWWMDVLGAEDMDAEQRGCEARMGGNDVLFLPYLMGERSPHNDVHARGAFIGMRPDTTRADMTLAVMEGMAFALKDCVEVARSNGLHISRAKLCGGGARSPLWQKIIADVCGVKVDIPLVEEGPAYGAAMLAMTAYGAYPSVEEAAAALVSTKYTVEPDAQIAAAYRGKYELFRALYIALKDTFARW